jgi:hypothetical protein
MASWSARRAVQDYRAARHTAPRKMRAQVCCGARRCGRTVQRRSLRSRATRTVPTPSTNARGAVPRTAGVISRTAWYPTVSRTAWYSARHGIPHDTTIPLRVVWGRGVGDCPDYRDRAASPSRSRPPTRRSRSRGRTPGPSRCAHTAALLGKLCEAMRCAGSYVCLQRARARVRVACCVCAWLCVSARARARACLCVCVCARETQCSVYARRRSRSASYTPARTCARACTRSAARATPKRSKRTRARWRRYRKGLALMALKEFEEAIKVHPRTQARTDAHTSALAHTRAHAHTRTKWLLRRRRSERRATSLQTQRFPQTSLCALSPRPRAGHDV